MSKEVKTNEAYNTIMHQCYYCEQLFDSKERLYDHVEVHSDVERQGEDVPRDEGNGSGTGSENEQ